MTPLHKALYKTLMEVKRKADCEQPLATINVMNRIAKFLGYGPLRGTTEVSGHYNLFLREAAHCSGCCVDCASLPFCPDGIPRVPPSARETLRGAITAVDFEFALGQLLNNSAPGPDGIPFEILRLRPACSREHE